MFNATVEILLMYQNLVLKPDKAPLGMVFFVIDFTFRSPKNRNKGLKLIRKNPRK